MNWGLSWTPTADEALTSCLRALAGRWPASGPQVTLTGLAPDGGCATIWLRSGSRGFGGSRLRVDPGLRCRVSGLFPTPRTGTRPP